MFLKKIQLQTITKSVLAYLGAIGQYVRLTLAGWKDLLGSVLLFTKSQLEKETWQRHIFFFSALALILFSVPGWISYQISFLGEPFQGVVASNSRFVFAISGLVCLLLHFFEIPAARSIALATIALCILVYTAGFFFPAPLHTYLQEQAEFNFTLWAYLSALPIVALAFTFHEALKRPTIKASVLKRFFKSGLSE